MPPSEKVEVKVGDGLPAIRAVVDHQAVAGFFQLELATDALGGGQEMAENGVIFRGNGSVAGVVLFGNEQDVNRGLGCDVAEGKDVVVLIDNVGGHLAIDDALEDRPGHGAGYQMVSSRREGLRVCARARMKWTISSLSFWQELRQDEEPVRERTQERRPSRRRAEARVETFSSTKADKRW